MRWIVCFQKPSQVGFWWFSTILSPKFKHCFIVKYCEVSDTWNLMEFHTGGFKFVCKRDENADFLVSNLIHNATCISYQSKRTRHKIPNFVWPWLYCVSFCKHVIGIKKWWVITPDQLHCELLKNGGEEIFKLDEDLSEQAGKEAYGNVVMES